MHGGETPVMLFDFDRLSALVILNGLFTVTLYRPTRLQSDGKMLQGGILDR